MAAYTPPEPPAPTGLPLADFQIAYSWTAQFFTVRAPIMRLIGSVLKYQAGRVP